jgi:hypothetical protein
MRTHNTLPEGSAVYLEDSLQFIASLGALALDRYEGAAFGSPAHTAQEGTPHAAAYAYGCMNAYWAWAGSAYLKAVARAPDAERRRHQVVQGCRLPHSSLAHSTSDRLSPRRIAETRRPVREPSGTELPAK